MPVHRANVLRARRKPTLLQISLLSETLPFSQQLSCAELSENTQHHQHLSTQHSNKEEGILETTEPQKRNHWKYNYGALLLAFGMCLRWCVPLVSPLRKKNGSLHLECQDSGASLTRLLLRTMQIPLSRSPQIHADLQKELIWVLLGIELDSTGERSEFSHNSRHIPGLSSCRRTKFQMLFLRGQLLEWHEDCWGGWVQRCWSEALGGDLWIRQLVMFRKYLCSLFLFLFCTHAHREIRVDNMPCGKEHRQKQQRRSNTLSIDGLVGDNRLHDSPLMSVTPTQAAWSMR